MNVKNFCRMGQMGFLVMGMIHFCFVPPLFSQDPCDWIEPQLELIPGSGPCCARVILKKSGNAPPEPILIEDFVGLHLELSPEDPGTFVSFATDPGWHVWLDELPHQIYFYHEDQSPLEIGDEGVVYGNFCLTPGLQGGIIVQYSFRDPISNRWVQCSTLVDLQKFCFETMMNCCERIEAAVNLKTLNPNTGEMTATVNVSIEGTPCDLSTLTIENSAGEILGTWDVGGPNPSSWQITFDKSLFKRQFIFKFTDQHGNVVYCTKTQDNWIEIPQNDPIKNKD